MNNPSSYRAISDTNVSRTDALTYCKRQSSSARAPSTPDTRPKTYVINKGIGNTYYATETAAPQSAAGAFLGGLASGLAAATAQRNALESCMLQLGYMKQEGYRSSSRTTYIAKPSDDAAQWDQYRLCTTALKSGAVAWELSLIHISEPTRRTPISYAVF